MVDGKPANLSLVYSKPNAFQRRWWTFGLPSYIRRTSMALFHGTNFEVPLRGNARRSSRFMIFPCCCILTRMKRGPSCARDCVCRGWPGARRW